jgi:hypothetical protein
MNKIISTVEKEGLLVFRGRLSSQAILYLLRRKYTVKRKRNYTIVSI